MSTRAHAAHIICARQHVRRGGRAEDDVSVCELGAQRVERETPAVKALSELDRFVHAAIGHDDGRTLHERSERGDERLSHLAGPDDDDALVVEAASKVLGRQLDCDVGKRRRAAGDRRFGAGALSDFDGMAKEPVENRTGGALAPGKLVRGTHLAKHFALAENGRIDARGNFEKVALGRLVELDEQRLTERLEIRRRVREPLLEELVDVGEPIMEAFGDRVDLGPHARRQHDAFGKVRAITKACQRLRRLVIGDRQPVEQLERSIPLVQADDDDRHSDLLGRRAAARWRPGLECYGLGRDVLVRRARDLRER